MERREGKYSAVARYAGLGFQWLVMLGLAVWGGLKLDDMIGVKALLVIVLPLVALVISFWQLLRTLKNNKK